MNPEAGQAWFRIAMMITLVSAALVYLTEAGHCRTSCICDHIAHWPAVYRHHYRIGPPQTTLKEVIESDRRIPFSMCEPRVPFEFQINQRRKEKDPCPRKSLTLFSLIVLLALVLSACAAPPAATEAPATEAPATEAPATEPPTPEATEPPATAEATEAPAEDFPEGVTAVITINLPEGATWSDGSALTAKDLVGTWDILWMRKSAIWDSLADVVAKDDFTVQFLITTPGPAVLDAIVRSNSPRPYSQYGKWMDAAAEFRAVGRRPRWRRGHSSQ